MTFVSKSKDLEKATGEEVKDVPANPANVTRAKNGEPSIDMNGQGSVDSLISQTLIKGNGAKLTDKNTVVVKYTGWLHECNSLTRPGFAIHNRRRSVQRFQRPASGYRGLAEGSGRPAPSALRFCW